MRARGSARAGGRFSRGRRAGAFDGGGDGACGGRGLPARVGGGARTRQAAARRLPLLCRRAARAGGGAAGRPEGGAAAAAERRRRHGAPRAAARPGGARGGGTARRGLLHRRGGAHVHAQGRAEHRVALAALRRGAWRAPLRQPHLPASTGHGGTRRAAPMPLRASTAAAAAG
eukprot:scaffold92048_cov69-Phaeocystis_antarctica.AAC.5